MFEQKDNSVALFHNDHRNNDKAPNYRGKGMVNGKEVSVSCWIKQDKSGNKFLSLSFQEPWKGGNKEQEIVQQKPVDSYSDMDDEIPFN